MTAGKLVFWRHGLTDWNAASRFQGQHDVALNAVGQAQAVAAAPLLKGLGPTALWASPLGRAQDTAGALAALTGLEVHTDPDLAEINVGDWVGLTTAEAYAADPGFEQAMRSGSDFRRSATGETATETGRRIAAAAARIAEEYGPDDVVVLATHGMATRMGIAALLGLDYRQAQLLAGPRNCSWSILEPAVLSPWRLLSYNNVPPLRDEGVPDTRHEAW